MLRRLSLSPSLLALAAFLGAAIPHQRAGVAPGSRPPGGTGGLAILGSAHVSSMPPVTDAPCAKAVPAEARFVEPARTIAAGKYHAPPSEAPSPTAPPAVDPACAAAGAGEGWLSRTQRAIAEEEYRATADAAGFQAPNRAQGFRTRFGEASITVIPRMAADEEPAWRFEWRLAQWGRQGRMAPVEPVPPSTNGARVTYERPGLREWYENTPKGLEQGFEVKESPRGEGPLVLEGALDGSLRALLDRDGVSVELFDARDVRVLRYADLAVWDATGREVPARLAVTRGALSIEIDDEGAAYPLLVDPLMTSPAWAASGNLQLSAWFGYSVATAGDVDGDGYSDVIVGAHLYDGGQTDEGRAYVYLGSASGLSGTPAWTAESDQASTAFGVSVATAGDVNGDGFSDVIVGAHRWDGGGQANEGRAFVYLGSASGLSATPAWTAESNQTDTGFGVSVATAGDVDADGYGDVIVGAPWYDGGHTDEGRAFVYLGSMSGLSAIPAWTAESNQTDASFGASVATAGDVDGDGYGDVIVGALVYDGGQPDEGRAYVYLGSASGLPAAPAWTAESDQESAWFGISVATAGDVNGDGFSDVIVGASSYDSIQSNQGRACAFLGSAAGLSTTPVWAAEGTQGGAFFGNSVAAAGDVNGDGYGDVIVGAYSYDLSPPFNTSEGRAYVYHGSAAGLASISAWANENNQANSNLGFSVATAGDVNGDGYSDVIIGAPLYDGGEVDEGRVYVHIGSRDGLSDGAYTIESDQAGANFGYSVAAAGDVNGDGYGDVIVGAWLWDGGQTDVGRAYVYLGSGAGISTTPAWTAESDDGDAWFGHSVATAGDVNGDGYGDVIVGAAAFSAGENGEGRSFVYLGSAAGLSDAPVWTGESNQFSARFGHAVAAAGDVNGDGYGDVIVGALLYNNGQSDEGRAYVYLGSAEGPEAAPAWTAESDQANAYFGVSVAGAGDVNGDGYGDVIVGAYFYDGGQMNEGRAYAYLGSPAGLGTTAAWTAESDQAASNFGVSVAPAGDANGDGYSDVIVGARAYDGGETDEGRACVYLGSAAGLSSTPAWTAESDQAGAFFGISVGTAGDVNGDGFSDVIVGAYLHNNGEQGEGRAYVYYGNDGDGLHRVPSQVRTDDTAPIAPLGRSDSETSFRLKALGRTPAGRGRVRLQWEVKPFGTPLDGTGLVTGPAFDSGAPTGAGSTVALSELASGLDPGTLHRWRVRILTDSPFFPRSPWLRQAGGAVPQGDVRTVPVTTAVDEEDMMPPLRRLGAGTPNPFRTDVRFSYTLQQEGDHRLDVFDVHGRRVVVLAEGVQPAGTHGARWDGRDGEGRRLAAGTYFIRLQTDGGVETGKVMLVH